MFSSLGRLDSPSREYLARFNELPQQVCPTQREDEEARAAVHRVTELLRQELPRACRVDRVHVGGSFGRRTSVRGCFDVDLLVFINDLDTSYEHRVYNLLDFVASVLVSAPGVCDGGRIETKPELCLVQLTSRGVGMDVLLVHNEAVDMAPYTDRAQLQRDKLVKPLFNSGDSCIAYIAKSPVDRSRERGVMEALTKFVQEHHTTANQAVRLFKAWVKLGLAKDGRLSSKKLPSVALELIALKAYARASQEGTSGDLLFRTFVGALRLAISMVETDPAGMISVVLLDAGQKMGYRSEQGMRFRACWGPAPYVIHPIDPTCNVARVPEAHSHRPPWDWQGLAREARALLGVMGGGSWDDLMWRSTLGQALRGL